MASRLCVPSLLGRTCTATCAACCNSLGESIDGDAVMQEEEEMEREEGKDERCVGESAAQRFHAGVGEGATASAAVAAASECLLGGELGRPHTADGGRREGSHGEKFKGDGAGESEDGACDLGVKKARDDRMLRRCCSASLVSTEQEGGECVRRRDAGKGGRCEWKGVGPRPCEEVEGAATAELEGRTEEGRQSPWRQQQQQQRLLGGNSVALLHSERGGMAVGVGLHGMVRAAQEKEKQHDVAAGHPLAAATGSNTEVHGMEAAPTSQGAATLDVVGSIKSPQKQSRGCHTAAAAAGEPSRECETMAVPGASECGCEAGWQCVQCRGSEEDDEHTRGAGEGQKEAGNSAPPSEESREVVDQLTGSAPPESKGESGGRVQESVTADGGNVAAAPAAVTAEAGKRAAARGKRSLPWAAPECVDVSVSFGRLVAHMWATGAPPPAVLEHTQPPALAPAHMHGLPHKCTHEAGRESAAASVDPWENATGGRPCTAEQGSEGARAAAVPLSPVPATASSSNSSASQVHPANTGASTASSSISSGGAVAAAGAAGSSVVVSPAPGALLPRRRAARLPGVPALPGGAAGRRLGSADGGAGGVEEQVQGERARAAVLQP